VTNGSRPPSDPPPWAAVIWTTLRLWVQRRAWPGRGDPAAAGRRYRRAAVLALLLVVFAAGAASVAIAQAGSARSAVPPAAAARPPAPKPPATAALAAAAGTRQQAAAWIASQVSTAAIVACDPLMCSALQQHGFPAADLAPLTAASPDPLGSGIVVATAAVRSQLGPRLARVYAPLVIASFGSGSSLVQVRVTAIGGAAAYLAAVRADLQSRQVAGRELAGNKDIRAPAAARAELSAGRVDSRLLITLAALAYKYPVQISGFGDAGPGASAGVPLRLVTIVAPTATDLRQVLAFLRAQRAPLLASIVSHRDGSATAVQVQFSAPSPTGLLGTGASP
jgi:hypothetical protein